MVSIGRKNLFAEKTRLFISVGGVAFSVLLILILLGVYQGIGKMAVAYIDSVKANLWVVQEGSADMFHSVSLIPADVEGKLKALPEVKEVNRLLARLIAFEINGKEVHTYIIGYDTERNIGGPIQISQGASQPKKGQIIIDKVFARSESLKVGDRVNISDRDFEVVGISEQGNMMMYQYSFVTQDDAEELMRMEGLSNYFLVSLKNPMEKDKAIQNINNIGGIQAVDKQDFAQTNSKVLTEAFLPVIGVLVLIGFGVGVVVIGLTIYTATVEKSREYGLLKAIGASNWQLYKVIFEQSLISGTLGYLVGAALSLVVVYFAEDLVPSFVVSTGPIALASILGLSVLMNLVASYIPVRRIVGIDPAMVFKS